MLTFGKAIRGNDKAQWRTANDTELTRLVRTRQTMHGIL